MNIDVSRFSKFLQPNCKNCYKVLYALHSPNHLHIVVQAGTNLGDLSFINTINPGYIEARLEEHCIINTITLKTDPSYIQARFELHYTKTWVTIKQDASYINARLEDHCIITAVTLKPDPSYNQARLELHVYQDSSYNKARLE